MHPDSASRVDPAVPPAFADARTNRLPVLVSVVVAAVWVVVVHAWRPPDFWPAALLRGVPAVLGVSFLVVLLLRHRNGWHRATELARVGPGLPGVPTYAPVSWFVAAEVQLLTLATVPLLELGVRADEEIPALTAPTLVLAAVGVLVLGWLVAAALTGRPRVELTPDAVHVRDLAGRLTVPWDALRAGTPVRPDGDRMVRLAVARPELVRRRGIVFGSRRRPLVLLQWLDVHPWFLADVLRWYVDHPAERASIGTAEGYARLRRGLGAP